MLATARQDLRRLLPALSCPACGSALRRTQTSLRCTAGHNFPVDAFGIPSLVREGDRSGRDISEEDAAAHAALHAFAGPALGRGEAEGLYRTVSDLLLRGQPKPAPRWLLDIGCGPGRTTLDAATAFPSAMVVGIDHSAGALTMAFAFAHLTGPSVEVDLQRWGFGTPTLPAFGVRNVLLARADAEHLPFARGDRWAGFDAITCVNLLDRTADPARALGEMARVAPAGARLVLTTPLNWRQRSGQAWQSLGSLDGLCSAVEAAGFAVDVAFDGLIYREILDARGSVTDWRVAVLSARRDAQPSSQPTLL